MIKKTVLFIAFGVMAIFGKAQGGYSENQYPIECPDSLTYYFQDCVGGNHNVEIIKDSSTIWMLYKTMYFPRIEASGPMNGYVLWMDSNHQLRKTSMASAFKRQETYSGTTDASGTYTVTFSTAYTVAPNIQASVIGNTVTQSLRITALSTTGFTILVQDRFDSIGSLPTYSNVTGASVDVLITEK